MRIVWRTQVTSVTEKSVTVGSKKSADGTAEFFTESAGWYIQLGNVSLFAGHEKPTEVETGDYVRLILEKDTGERK
jgi:hypothetical protein